jgi:hypothetical protein
MKIAIFSDIHANLPALEAFSLIWRKKTLMSCIALVTWWDIEWVLK